MSDRRFSMTDELPLFGETPDGDDDTPLFASASDDQTAAPLQADAPVPEPDPTPSLPRSRLRASGQRITRTGTDVRTAILDTSAQGCWKVLVIDDEPAVRRVTQLALRGLRVDGLEVVLFTASSAAEGRELVAAHPDAAVAIIDVVMEQDDSGLVLTRWIRETLENPFVRIVIRTGQPGTAPEQRVMTDYDINDYWSKTELTKRRLVTALTGAIRSFRDLRTIMEQRRGLQEVMAHGAALMEPTSMARFARAMITSTAAILMPGGDAALVAAGDAERIEQTAHVLAGTGRFAGMNPRDVMKALGPQTWRRVLTSLAEVGEDYDGDPAIFTFKLGDCPPLAVVLREPGRMGAHELATVRLFVRNAASTLRTVKSFARQQELLTAFARFVPPEAIQLHARKDVRGLSLGDAVRREMTVLFLDLVGFSTRAEQLDPLQTLDVVNRQWEVIVPLVREHGGYIDKFLGDGLLAVFPRRATDAVQAATAIKRAVRELSVPGGRLPVSMGIHTGPAVAGVVGAPDRLELTVISDVVNVASRLEGMTRVVKAPVLCTPDVRVELDAGPRANTRPIAVAYVKGRKSPLLVYEFFGFDDAAVRQRKRATASAIGDALAAIARGDNRDGLAILRGLRRTFAMDMPLKVLLAAAEKQIEAGDELARAWLR